jgi:hypothetical protein
MELKFKINLTESQKEAYEAAHNKKRYLTLVWSRQSGKSTLMKILCIEWLFKDKKQIAYICRNYILAKRLYKDVVQYIPEQFVKRSNGSDLSIETIFGSTLTFFSAESGASLRGLTFHYMILDEFAFFKMEQTDGTNLWYDILYPTIKVRGKKVIFVSTPLGKNNLFYEMYIRGFKTGFSHSYTSILKDIYSDGLVSEQEIEDIKKQIPELSFRQEFLCEFLDSSLTFFNGFEQCFKDFIYNDNLKQYIGVDLSGNGTDETIVTKINSDNQVCQYKVEGTLDEKYRAIAYIINTTKNLQYSYIEINGLGAPMLNEIKKLVKEKHKLQEWVTSNKSKEEIISNLAVTIANKDISFNNQDKELFAQFGTFISKYTKTGHLQLQAQEGHKDDRIMSLAIALESKKLNKTYNKQNFEFINNNLSSFNIY